MDLTKEEFEHEVKKAMGYLLEIEGHAEEMDPDDIKYFCEQVRFPLRRILDGIQSGKIKAEKF